MDTAIKSDDSSTIKEVNEYFAVLSEQLNFYTWIYDYMNSCYIFNAGIKDNFSITDAVGTVPQCEIDAELIHPDDVDGYTAMYDSLRSGEKNVSLDYRRKMSGTNLYSWVRESYTAVTDKEGNYTKAIGSIICINDTKITYETYKNRIESWYAIHDMTSCATVHLNLTQNTIIRRHLSDDPDFNFISDCKTADDVYAVNATKIIATNYSNSVNKESSIENYIMGFMSTVIYVRMLLGKNSERLVWLEIHGETLQNPVTHDIEFLMSYDMMNASSLMKRISFYFMKTRYDVIEYINLSDNTVITYKSTPNGYFDDTDSHTFVKSAFLGSIVPITDEHRIKFEEERDFDKVMVQIREKGYCRIETTVKGDNGEPQETAIDIIKFPSEDFSLICLYGNK